MPALFKTKSIMRLTLLPVSITFSAVLQKASAGYHHGAPVPPPTHYFPKPTSAPAVSSNATSVVTPTFAPVKNTTASPAVAPVAVSANSTSTPAISPTIAPVATPTSPFHIPSSVLCFSGTSSVQVLNKGVLAMKDLQIGDKVLNAKGEFDTVYSFGHYAPNVLAEFIQIHATGISQPVEISKEHMLFVMGGSALPASAIVVGDKIQLLYNNHGATAQVKKIVTVVRRGVYAPFTMSGTVVVNNVVASSYVDLQNNKDGVFKIASYPTPFSVQFLAHLFQASHRLTCKISPSYCQRETYDKAGVSSRVAGPYAFAKWALKQNAVVMLCIFIVSFLIGLIIYLLELIFCTSSLHVLLILAVASILAIRANKKVTKEV